ncbi:MAG: hypothetical protein IJJ45_10100 [Clostridia bacterium]|nr:hypothetical protein [Clostridia bacterium]
MNTQNAASSTSNLQRPSKQRPLSLRGLVSILLLVLLPPLGLLFMWRNGVFRTRGRMLLTTLATLEMMAIAVLITPRAQLSTQMPLPAAPVSVTAAPEEENLSALYNIEELIYARRLEEVKAQGGDETDLMTEAEKLEKQTVDREKILNTIVYAVYNHAVRYHAQMVCGTQSNGRALTVQEAMMEALSPCPDCNPPVWTD